MKLSDFDYNLPKELIAQEPIRPRDHSRLLVFDKKTGKIDHKHFYNIVDYFQTGDVLVLNNSKVFPARLIGKKEDSGGKMEVFLLKHKKGKIWQCLVGGRGARVGLVIKFDKNLKTKVIKDNRDGTWDIGFNKSDSAAMKTIYQIGKVPLPPYVKRSHYFHKNDVVNYQTIFAKKVGSIAAPTAGFHFTPKILKQLKSKGVKIKFVTLHVGLGTFAPVKVNDIVKHKMHAEWVEVKKDVTKEIIAAKQQNRRVIAVGTTSTRALESVFSQIVSRQQIKDFSGWINIFIYPGYKFKAVDALITNFHLSKSSLLMLVSAFAKTPADKSAVAGINKIMKVYQEAVEKKYRFYSYGDAMLIY